MYSYMIQILSSLLFVLNGGPEYISKQANHDMKDIHTDKGVKCQCSPEGMIHGLIRVGFDPFLNHIHAHVVSIYFLLHIAISNHMFMHDNFGIAKLRA